MSPIDLDCGFNLGVQLRRYTGPARSLCAPVDLLPAATGYDGSRLGPAAGTASAVVIVTGKVVDRTGLLLGDLHDTAQEALPAWEQLAKQMGLAFN